MSELRALGAVTADARIVRHGRSSGSLRAAALPATRLPAEGAGTATLSPVLLPGGPTAPTWIDLYDDWALAPDINRWYRQLARVGYRRVRRRGVTPTVVTVNSQYMADRVRPAPAVVVPNGVDAELGRVPTSGDAAARLLVFGHFFRGRTDFALLERVAARNEFDEVVIAGTGSASEVHASLRGLRDQIGDRLVVHEWLAPEETARLVGPRTVALIPNLVSDYTLSQDPMKAYQFLALGVRVICPRLLWPSTLEPEFAFLLDHGVRLDGNLREWLRGPAPDEAWRRAFADEHSWAARARTIAGLLSGGRGHAA